MMSSQPESGERGSRPHLKRRRPSIGAASGGFGAQASSSGAGFSPFVQSKRARTKDVEWGGELPDRSFHRWGNYDSFAGYDPTNPRNSSGRFADADVLQDPRLSSIDKGLFAGASVLDIGCGAGYLCLQMAERLGAARVLGIDIDAALAAKARRLLAYRKALYASGGSSNAPPNVLTVLAGADTSAFPVAGATRRAEAAADHASHGDADGAGLAAGRSRQQRMELLPSSVRTSQRWSKPPPHLIPAPVGTAAAEEGAGAAAAAGRRHASSSSSAISSSAAAGAAGAGSGVVAAADDRFFDADDTTDGDVAIPRDERFVDADDDDDDDDDGSRATASAAPGRRRRRYDDTNEKEEDGIAVDAGKRGYRASSASAGGTSAGGSAAATAPRAVDQDVDDDEGGAAAVTDALLPTGLRASTSDDGRAAAEAAVAAVFRSDESDSDSRSSGSHGLAASAAAAADGSASNPPAGAEAASTEEVEAGTRTAAAAAAASEGAASPAPPPSGIGIAADSPAAVLARLSRVHFLCQDYVEGGGGGARGGGAVTVPPSSFDIVTLFNVTKYVHLNGGDEAVRSLLSRAHAALRPGGRLLLIAQDWESYGRSRHLCVGFSAQYGRIRFKPADFLAFLLEEVGFRRLHAAVRVRKPASRHGTSQLLVLEK